MSSDLNAVVYVLRMDLMHDNIYTFPSEIMINTI